MKYYPSIPYPDDFALGQHCYAFYKYDGSNLRFEWSKKQGWYKYGTRNRLFDKTDPDFGSAIELFMNTYADGLAKVFAGKEYRNSDRAIVFAEFFGPNSFAGSHVATDTKQLMLFDVNLHKKGILDPKRFIGDFGHLNVAQVIYEGEFTQEFIDSVYQGNQPVVEGVIVKGGTGHSLWMRKVKTAAYKQRLKELFKTDWEKYW
jgi:hypothetical protein